MRIRHIVLPLVGVSAVYMMLSFFNGGDSATQAPLQAAALQPVQPVPVMPLRASAPHHDTAHNNLKAAFDATPVKPSYAPYAAAPEPSTLSRRIASLQSGLNTLLEAGSDMLVSTRKIAVGKGDTLMDLLVENNVPRTEAYEAIQALSKVYDPRDLNPGHEVTVFFHRDPSIADPKFSGLAIEKDIVNTVTVERDGDGSFTADQEAKDIHRSLKSFKGNIDGSLYVSAKANGVPDGVILDLIKMYSLNVDFQRDIQSGDAFEVMYEQYVTEQGDVVPGKGDILYAKLALDDRILPLYRFEDSAGEVGFYDADGKSAKRSLMKTPIDGARMSSGFGMRRHPVLGYSKMHKGVDFAAPRGTPIYAAGDGTIVKMGPFSSYGKYIRIRHGNGLDTAYAHMNGFKPGLKSGARVKQGQVIGYVGTTGRSTGPHLHFEVMQSGKQINPNTIKLPQSNTLAGKDLKKFKALVAERDRAFGSASEGDVMVSRPSAPVRTASRR